MSSSPPPFTLRPYLAADFEFLYRVQKEGMADYVIATWGRWDEAEQRAKLRERLRPDTLHVVRVGGQDAGILGYEVDRVCVALNKLFLLPGYRDRGVGSALLRHMIGVAEREGKPLRLGLLRVNRGARRLYNRFGFRVFQETPERVYMERRGGLDRGGGAA